MAQTESSSSQAEWNDPGLTHRQVRLTLIGVMLAMFLASLDQTIVATAIPRIMADLDGFDRVTWVSRAYIVASTSVVLIPVQFQMFTVVSGCLWVVYRYF